MLAHDGLLTLRSEIRHDDAAEDVSDPRHLFTVTELRDLLQHSGVLTVAGEAQYFEKSGVLQVPLQCGTQTIGRGYFSGSGSNAGSSLVMQSVEHAREASV